MQQLKSFNYPTNAFGRFWMKIPLVFRSVFIGFIVSSLGVGIWTVLATTIPPPWSLLLTGIMLILFWKYFSGKWKPLSTQTYRQFCIRQINLKKEVWGWGLLAGVSIVIFLHVCLMFTFRLVDFEPETFKTLSYLNDLPTWQAWSAILGISVVAGICEEIGFRGYMQKPLEQKYGPIISISITSLVFVLVHLHQAWAGGIVVHIFIISSMIGYLAYSTNSLLPGIIAHITFDIVNVSYWWSDIIGTFEHRPIGMTGVDNHFIFTLLLVLLSFVLFIFAIRKLLRIKNSL